MHAMSTFLLAIYKPLNIIIFKNIWPSGPHQSLDVYYVVHHVYEKN